MSAEPQRVVDLLRASAREFVESLGGNGCAISRALGDLLVLVAEHTVDGRTLQLGQGYLVSDYPETGIVLASRTPKSLSLTDPDVDPAEAALLREYGFDSLLMLPLELHGKVWGLVEVYGSLGRQFAAEDLDVAARIAARTAESLQGL